MNRLEQFQGFAAYAAFDFHVMLLNICGCTAASLSLSWRMPQRTFKGTCTLCGASVDKRRSTAHYITCAPAHDLPTGRHADLLRIRVGAVGAAEYWLDVEAGAGAALSNLDAFLRRATTVRSYAVRTRRTTSAATRRSCPL